MFQNKPQCKGIGNKHKIPLSIFQSTLLKFYDLEKKGEYHAMHALGLYMFYYKTSINQETSQLYATEHFTRNGTGLSERKFKGAKKVLKDLGLISDTWFDPKTKKSFFVIYIDTNNSLTLEVEKSTEVTKRHRDETSPINALTRTINALTTSIKSSKEDKKASPSKKFFLKKSLNKVSKTDKTIVKTEVKPCPKIYKKIEKIEKKVEEMSCNPYKKREKQAGYKYTNNDMLLYKSLIKEGATEHRLDSKTNNMTASYYYTMDAIHEILDPKCRNPYSGGKNINKEFIDKIWTIDEVIDAFKYYVSVTDPTLLQYKNIRIFIYAIYSNSRSWSPLVKYFIDMNKTNGSSLEGDEKKFHSESKRLFIDKYFDGTDIKRIIKMITSTCFGYVPNPNYRSTYFDSILYVFFEYVESRIRAKSFRPGFIGSLKFIQSFFDEYVTNGMLVPRTGV
jgi:hypothetical protein